MLAFRFPGAILSVSGVISRLYIFRYLSTLMLAARITFPICSQAVFTARLRHIYLLMVLIFSPTVCYTITVSLSRLSPSTGMSALSHSVIPSASCRLAPSMNVSPGNLPYNLWMLPTIQLGYCVSSGYTT